MKFYIKGFKLLFVTLILFFVVSCANKTIDKHVVDNAIKLEAEKFPLSNTRLLDGSPFKHAMNKDAEWLLALEPDRLLHRFRLNAGLQPKGDIYGGWESRGVSGHTLGHYLSACSMMYAASGDNRFKERVDYIINELAECQDARKTGYVGAIPDEDRIWDEVSKGDIRSEGFDLNGGWVPWYTQHKIWAGLIDAYLYANNTQAKEIAVKLSDWAVRMFGNLSDDQFQTMLACEFGGMNESFAEMYSLTGKSEYLDMAEKFYHKEILDPLKDKHDELEGKHSNTQVPKIIGAARMYELTGEKRYETIATFYWDRIVNFHTYLNGGNSNYEHLGHPGCLNDRLSAYTSETCNTYNMLKLTKHLFQWETHAYYMDYYERALYNHILASQNADDGMVCYSVPLETGTEKIFSTPFDSFWCCVASGIENHVKYAESVFFKASDGGLFVNLFIPTELNWDEENMKVRLETEFPESDTINISFDGKKHEFPLHIRFPKWAKNGAKVFVNDIEREVEGVPGSYITINGEWGEGTKLKIIFPMDIYTESMPDNKNRVGFFYGPILLSAELGNSKLEDYDIPIFISDSVNVAQYIVKEKGSDLTFKTRGASNYKNLSFIPFYKIHGQKHAVYFDVFSHKEWRLKEQEYNKMREAKKELESRTIDVLRIGEMQPERDHNLQSENSSVGDVNGQKYRHARNGWFSFDVEVDSLLKQQMVCSYWGSDKGDRNFDIYIDGILFKEVSLLGENGSKVFDTKYDIPLSFTKGKTKVTVKFQSRPDNFAGGLFGFRIIKK